MNRERLVNICSPHKNISYPTAGYRWLPTVNSQSEQAEFFHKVAATLRNQLILRAGNLGST